MKKYNIQNISRVCSILYYIFIKIYVGSKRNFTYDRKAYKIGFSEELLYPRHPTKIKTVISSLVLQISGGELISANCDIQYGSQHRIYTNMTVSTSLVTFLCERFFSFDLAFGPTDLSFLMTR